MERDTPVSQLELVVHRTGRETVVELRGDADRSNTALIARTLVDLATAAPDLLIVDAEGVTFMDSAGMGLLVDVALVARANGGHVVVRRPSAAARRVLDLTSDVGYLDVVT